MYLPIITAFACDQQVKKVLKSVKQNIISRFHPLTPEMRIGLDLDWTGSEL